VFLNVLRFWADGGLGFVDDNRFDAAPAPPSVAGQDQWLRRWSLILTSETTGNAVTLSEDRPGFDLRILFETQASDSETPGIGIVTVFNIKPETAADVVKEFDRVILQAGISAASMG